MILFVSGRCDIPAFFTTWFFNRMKEGYVDVRNPYNEHQISRILLQEDYVDCLVFCTKNPLAMMHRLDEITLPYMFQVTLTPYHNDIEEHVPDKRIVMQAIKDLSNRLGIHRVSVRYDPILLTTHYTTAYHIRAFEKLCKSLQGSVTKIILSFVDMYKNTKHNRKKMQLLEMKPHDMIDIASAFGKIAVNYNMQLQTCAEDIDLTPYHIKQGLCIDQEEIESILGHSIERAKGMGVRKNCKCMPSVDIGDYNCCMHTCLYCYANYDEQQIAKRVKSHNPQSSLLLGELNSRDIITIREKKEIKQLSIL